MKKKISTPGELIYGLADNKRKVWIEINNKCWNGDERSLNNFFEDSLIQSEKLVSNLVIRLKMRPKVVADIGAGYGQLAVNFAKLGIKTVAVEPGDVERKVIAYFASRSITIEKNLRILNGTAEKIPLKDNFVDLCVFSQVLEHVQDPKKSIREIARILKPEGYIHLSCPNYNFPIEQHYHLPYLPFMSKKLFSIWALLVLKILNTRKIKNVKSSDFGIVKTFIDSLNYTNDSMIKDLCKRNQLKIVWSSSSENKDIMSQIRRHWRQNPSFFQLLLIFLSLPKKILRSTFASVGLLPMKLEYLIYKPVK